MDLAAFGTFASTIEVLLKRRNVAPSDIAAFLTPDYHAQTHDPFLFADMHIAIDRLFLAMENNERIAIYADFDCDGIPGAVVLKDFFEKIQYTNVEVYIPHRDLEGYGLHTDAIDELAEHNVTLVITVDLGTVAYEGIAYAKKKGVDVIVTDHHEPGPTLPDAVAIINPKRAPYPFPHLCGAAVAYKVVQAALSEGKRRELANFADISNGWERWLLDLVGIATVADMVPLVGENRVLARFGLTVLRKSPRPGIAAICRALRIQQRDLTEDDIGFSIAPRVNAASRMDNPELAFRLLSTKSVTEAEAAAAQLEKLNKERKGVVASIAKEIKKRIKERHIESPLIVLGDPDWKPSLLGLAATAVVGDHGGAVCLWGRDGNGVLKGSCRSDGCVSVVALFQAAEDALEEYGGHHAAGGFSVSHEKVHALPAVLEECFQKVRTTDIAVAVDAYDADVALAELTWDFYNALTVLAPFGLGNTKPVFRFLQVQVTDVRQFGKASEHLEITIADDSGRSAKAISFFSTAESFSKPLSPGARLDVLASLEKSTFGRSPELRLRLVDAV